MMRRGWRQKGQVGGTRKGQSLAQVIVVKLPAAWCRWPWPAGLHRHETWVVLPLDCPPLGIERGHMPSRRSNSTLRREAAVHERHEDHGQTYPQHNFKGQHCGIGRWPHFRVQGAEVAVCSGFRSATLCKHRHSPGNWSSTLEKHAVASWGHWSKCEHGETLNLP